MPPGSRRAPPDPGGIPGRAGAAVPLEPAGRGAGARHRGLVRRGHRGRRRLAALGPEAPWDQRADLHSLVSRAASHDFDLAVASRHGGLAVDLAEAHGDAARWAAALIRWRAPSRRTPATAPSRTRHPSCGRTSSPTRMPTAPPGRRCWRSSPRSAASYDDLDGAAEAAAEAAVALPEDAAPGLASSSRSPKAWPTGPDSTCRARAMPSSERRARARSQRRSVGDLCRGPPGVGEPAPRPHRPGGGRNPRAGHHAAGRTDLGGARAADGGRRVGRRRPRRARPSRARPRGGRAVDEPLWLRLDPTDRVSRAGVPRYAG